MSEHGGYSPTEMPPRESQHTGVPVNLRPPTRVVAKPKGREHGGWSPTEMPPRESQHAGLQGEPRRRGLDPRLNRT